MTSGSNNTGIFVAWLRRSALGRLAGMYRDGFGRSPLARKLLWLIIIKVAILLVVFKLWLMPNRLNRDYQTDEERAQGVRTEMLRR